jgi:hypothetical protein
VIRRKAEKELQANKQQRMKETAFLKDLVTFLQNPQVEERLAPYDKCLVKLF